MADGLWQQLEGACPTGWWVMFVATDGDDKTIGRGGGNLPRTGVWSLTPGGELVDPAAATAAPRLHTCGVHVHGVPWFARLHAPFPSAVVWAVAVDPQAVADAIDVDVQAVACARVLRKLSRDDEATLARGVVELWGPRGTFARLENGQLHSGSDGQQPSRVTATGRRLWHTDGDVRRIESGSASCGSDA